MGPGRGSTPPSFPLPGGWGGHCRTILTARGNWCGGSSAVTAPPRSPTFRAGWAAPPSRPSGCGAASQRSWRRWVLAEDLDLLTQGEEGERLLLLGPHDPYLDLRDRDLILPDKARQRQVWKTVGNPGAVLLGGRVIGFWTVRTKGEKLDVSATLFEPLSPAQRSRLEELVSSYAAFRGTALRAYTVL